MIRHEGHPLHRKFRRCPIDARRRGQVGNPPRRRETLRVGNRRPQNNNGTLGNGQLCYQPQRRKRRTCPAGRLRRLGARHRPLLGSKRGFCSRHHTVAVLEQLINKNPWVIKLGDPAAGDAENSLTMSARSSTETPANAPHQRSAHKGTPSR